MFTIIGGDGNEYGPVSVEQIRAWLASGRANLDTKAKHVGYEEWKRLGDFDEFAGPAAAVTPPPLAAAESTGPVDPKVLAGELIARAGKLDIGNCLDGGWQLLKQHFWPLVGATFVVMVVAAVAGALPMIGILVSLLLGGVFNGGLYYYYLKKLRGQPAEFGDAFSGFSLALVPLMLATLVVTLITVAGFVLLILPGIYLAVAYTFTYLLVIDRKLEFWTAMEVSRRVVTAQWWRIFGLLILGFIITLLGLVGLVIGIFITLPIATGAVVCAYEALCNPPPPK
jgi:hypothetical protein